MSVVPLPGVRSEHEADGPSTGDRSRRRADGYSDGQPTAGSVDLSAAHPNARIRQSVHAGSEPLVSIHPNARIRQSVHAGSEPLVSRLCILTLVYVSQYMPDLSRL